ELMVVVALTGVVLTIFLGTLMSVQTAVGKETDRSDSNDQARLAVEALDREIRSGNLLYAPTAGGMNLVIYTQTNATTRNPGNRLVVAMMVLFIAVLLGIVTYRLSVHSATESGFDRKRYLAVNAAEAGIDTTFARLQTATSLAALPCGSNALQGTVAGSPATS